MLQPCVQPLVAVGHAGEAQIPQRPGSGALGRLATCLLKTQQFARGRGSDDPEPDRGVRVLYGGKDPTLQSQRGLNVRRVGEVRNAKEGRRVRSRRIARRLWHIPTEGNSRNLRAETGVSRWQSPVARGEDDLPVRQCEDAPLLTQGGARIDAMSER